MKKTLATLGIIGVGVLGATLTIDKPVEPKPIKLDISAIKTSQDTEKSVFGDYIQVTKDGRTLLGNEQINSKIIDFLPKNIEIHVYDGPNGKGYQVIEHTPTSTISTGFGPEAKSRTYINVISTKTATTTP